MRRDPYLADGLLFAQAKDGLYAVAASNGAVRWRQPSTGTGDRLGQRLAVADGVVYVVADHLFAVDAASGVIRWTWPRPAGVGLGDPAVSGGLVYVAGGSTRNIYVIDARTGALRTTLAVASRTGFDRRSALTVTAGRILVELYGESRAYSLNAATGAVLWLTESFDDPVLAGDAVYVTTPYGHGTLLCLDALTGAERWLVHPADPGIPMSHTFSTLAVAGGVVHVAQYDGQVDAVSASTADPPWGDRRWAVPTSDRILSPPAVAGGVVYVATDDGRLQAFDAATGAPRGMARPGLGVKAPLVSNGVVYAGTSHGWLYAYDAASFR